MLKTLPGLTFAILALLVSGLACKGYTEGKPAAEKAIAEFHSMLDAGRFEEIYDSSDKAMKNATTKEQLTKLLNAVHTKLGTTKESTEQSWHIGNYNLTTTVTIVDETIFQNGKAIETFTYVIDGNQTHLAGYNINSTELVTN